MGNQEKNFSTNNKKESEANLFETTNEELRKNQSDSKKYNTIASLIKIIAIIFYVIAVIALLLLMVNDSDQAEICVIYVISCTISGTLLLGFGEIINLLQKILDKR